MYSLRNSITKTWVRNGLYSVLCSTAQNGGREKIWFYQCLIKGSNLLGRKDSDNNLN